MAETYEALTEDVKQGERNLQRFVEDEILEVANVADEVTTSDLQGIASATAQRIIKAVHNKTLEDLKHLAGVSE